LRFPPFFKLDNGSKVDANTAACIFLGRFSQPSSLASHEAYFAKSKSMICRIFNIVLTFLHQKINERIKWDQTLLTPERIRMSSMKIHEAGCPSQKCWGFIDGTMHKICRPDVENRLQQSFFNGRKKQHGIQFQVITMADGMLFVSNPYPGVTHDARIFVESGTEEKLESLPYPWDDGMENEFFHIYADKGYMFRSRRLLSAFVGNGLTEDERLFNDIMKPLRVSVENILAKQANLITQRLKMSPVGQQFIVSIFLVNCHSCLYGNQVSSMFGLSPPSLEMYLAGFVNESNG
jgi:hypothetical protein